MSQQKFEPSIVEEQVTGIPQQISDAGAFCRAFLDCNPLPSAVCHCDDGSVVYANKHLRDVFALETAQMTSTSLAQFFKAPNGFESLMNAVAGQEASDARETEFVRGDQTEFWALVSAQKLSFGDRPCLVIVINDLNDIKRSQRALRNSEARARRAHDRLIEALDCISDAFALFGKDDRMVLCNANYKRFHPNIADILVPGVQFETLLNRQLDSGALRIGDGTRAETYDRRMAMHRGERGLYEIELDDGRWLLSNERSTQDGGTVLVQTDITELKHNQQAVELAHERLVGALEALPAMLFLYGADNRLALTNSAARSEDSPWRDFAVVGTKFEDVARAFHGSSQNRAPVASGHGNIDQPQGENTNAHQEFEHRLSDGRTFRVLARPLPDGGAIKLHIDVSKQKRIEDELRRAKEVAESTDRAKSVFLAQISHELRTPLNAILGYANLIDRATKAAAQMPGSPGATRCGEYARLIRASGQHLLQLINDVLDMAQSESGNLHLRDEIVDLYETAQTCVDMLHERARATDIKLDAALEANLPLIRGDARRIRQILINLLGNAIKFTPAGGGVSVNIYQLPNRDIAIKVSDTGIGMRTEDIPKALTPFVQLESGLDRRYEGTGLGLPLTKNLVELHDGKMTIVSALNEGTTTTVTLPAERTLSPNDRR